MTEAETQILIAWTAIIRPKNDIMPPGKEDQKCLK